MDHSIIEQAQLALKEAKKQAELNQKTQPAPPVPKEVPPVEVPMDSEEVSESLESLETFDEISKIPDSDLSSQVEMYRPPVMPMIYTDPPASSIASLFQKFGDIPTTLRENVDNVNVYEVKKLNLAATIESLERAVQSHESMPSPDAAFAVSSLSEQVMKLTKDLEKSIDPRKMLDEITAEILEKMTEHVVFVISSEMKWLMGETAKIVPTEKQTQVNEAIKNATRRVAPALSETLEIAKNRLVRILNIKDKGKQNG
jgi:hypothetical protein